VYRFVRKLCIASVSLMIFSHAFAQEAWHCPEQGWQQLSAQSIDQSHGYQVERWLETKDLANCNLAKGQARLAYLLINQGEVDQAVAELLTLLHQYPSINDQLPLLFTLGLAYRELTDFAAEREQYFKVLNAALREGLRVKKLKAKIYIVQSYIEEGQDWEAVSWARQALDDVGQLSDLVLLSEIYDTIALLYLNQDWLNQSYGIRLESLKVELQMGASASELASTYHDLAVLEWYRGNFRRSLDYSEQALQHCRQYQDELCFYTSYLYQGMAYTSLAQLSAAEQAFEGATARLKLIKEPYAIQYYLIYYALYLSASEQADKTLAVLEAIQQVASVDEDNYIFYRAYNQRAISQIYQNLQRYREALDWQIKYAATLKQWQSDKNSKALVSMMDELTEVRHLQEMDVAESEAADARAALQLARLKQEHQQRIQAYQTVALLLLVLLFVYAIYNRRVWQHRARYDRLTGCLNRAAVIAAVNRRARSGRRDLAILLFDLDHFKQINDRYGHPIGDRALAAVAERISGDIKRRDLLGRVGGEEFMFCAAFDNQQDIAALAQRL